jgi:hypothetical protein
MFFLSGRSIFGGKDYWPFLGILSLIGALLNLIYVSYRNGLSKAQSANSLLDSLLTVVLGVALVLVGLFGFLWGGPIPLLIVVVIAMAAYAILYATKRPRGVKSVAVFSLIALLAVLWVI